jgi:STE24 endopeptidase
MRALAIASYTWLILGPPVTMFLGYGHWIQVDLQLSRVPLAAELVALIPFISGLVIYWILEYPSHLAMRRKAAQLDAAMGGRHVPEWTLGGYLSFQVRFQLLFVAAPIALILLLVDSLELYIGPLLAGWAWADAVMTLLVLAVAGGVFLLAPPMLVRIWRTSTLPAGSVRSELEAMCGRMNLRYRRLLIWHSQGVLINAAVVGFLRPLRYVLLSDGMLDQMYPEQIKAIFAHEAGHIKHHHLIYAVMFAVSTILLANVLVAVLAVLLGIPALAALGIGLTLLLATWAVGFGWLSRRFERQSDTVAAWSCGPPPESRNHPDEVTPEGAATFAGALDQVARLNRISRNQFNWRHGSIAWRVAHVLHLGATRGSRADIDRLVRRIQIALWIALAAGIGLSWWVHAGLGVAPEL